MNQLDIQAAISAWQRFPGDTGSPEVQIAIWTQKIKIMATHMQQHKKDTYTRRRLILAVHARNRMLKYLRRHNRALRPGARTQECHSARVQHARRARLLAKAHTQEFYLSPQGFPPAGQRSQAEAPVASGASRDLPAAAPHRTSTARDVP